MRRPREPTTHQLIVVQDVGVQLKHLGDHNLAAAREDVLVGLGWLQLFAHVNLGVREETTFGPDDGGVVFHHTFRLELLEHTFFGVEAVPGGSHEENERDRNKHDSDGQLN